MRNVLFTVLLSAALFTAPVLSAQHIGYIIPAGGKQGETVEILLGGQQLWGIKSARVSGGGVTVESVSIVPGMPIIGGKQHRFVATWMRNVVDGKKEIPQKPTDEEELKTWRKHPWYDTVDKLTPLQFHLLTRHLFVPRNSLQMSPAINTNAIIRLKIAPDAKPGRREFRLVRGNGMMSNALPFYVDTIPGVREPYLAVPPKKNPKYTFTLPCVINGQIMPGETDVWHFTAKKDEKLVFQTFARQMIPFMGDCVPGYFQCVLELRDSKNRRVAYADDSGFDPDPILCCTIPEDGEYALHVRDSIYRGRADFVYRIRAWRGDPPEFRLTVPALKLPKKQFRELANGRTEYPVLVEGCIDRPGKTDQVVIRAKKGEKIVGEVFARRLGSHLDSRLTVLGPDGKQVAFNDDFPRFLVGPILQHIDSYLCFTAPQDGDYTFRLTDTAALGSPKHGYFLRIDRPRPSFRLYVVPSVKPVAINGATKLKLQVEPIDGFHCDIKLRVKAQYGYAIIGSNIIPAGCKSTEITLTCPDKQRQLVPAELIAEYEVSKTTCPSCGRVQIETRRGEVCYGDEDTQAFAYTHVIPASNWHLSKTWAPTGLYHLTLADPKRKKVTIPAGKTATIVLRRAKLPPKSTFSFSLPNAPKGLTLEKVLTKDLDKGRAEITLVIRASEKMEPQRFNLPIMAAYSYNIPYLNSPPNKKGKDAIQRSDFNLPVLLFEITKGK
ncbi:MAG: hypothetical protein J5806_09470 [Lentisphaeria bacterium]|nr:hypothetical protein [Lentisphaeria bacterium]